MKRSSHNSSGPLTTLLAAAIAAATPAWFAHVTLAAEAAATTVPAAAAAPAAAAPNFSGDIWTRPALTGDWGGVRNELAIKGVTLDMYASQVFQGVLTGGLDKGWNYGGRENIQLNLDTGKMGLWPGGFFTLEGEGNYGEFVGPRQTGALIPADANAMFPDPDGPQFDLIAVNYAQFISHNLGFLVGKIDTLSGDANAFAHGKGDHQFLNTNFSFNPVFAVTAPYSALGVSMIILPTGDPDEFLITASVIDTEGRPDTAGFDTVFKGGTTYAGEARYTTHFLNLKGHQLLGGTYSDRLYTSVNQDLRNFIIPDLPIQQSSGSWCVYYNFDQYLFQPDPKSDTGVGIFGRFGISDGEANPIHYFGSLGLGGKGLIPCRKNDQFGIGVYRTCTASSPALDTLNFHDAQGFEAYYEIAITPAVFLTPDIQVIDPSQENVKTACVLGFRLTTKF